MEFYRIKRKKISVLVSSAFCMRNYKLPESFLATIPRYDFKVVIN